MVRAISMMGMAGTFLVISPKLRGSLLGTFTQAGISMDLYSPYSYIALGVTVLALLMIFFHKASQPR